MTISPVFFIICLLAYLLGSVPIGFMVARAQGVDISQAGSGNIGATNISRVLGRKLGVLVGVLDFLKCFVPVLLARHFIGQDWQVILISIMPVLGHVFPVWLNFRGGKGVATIFGILAGFFGLLSFLLFLLVWLLVVRVVKIMSLVNLVVGLLIPWAFWFKFNDLYFTMFGLVLCLIIWWRHRENISRLLAGNEKSISG